MSGGSFAPSCRACGASDWAERCEVPGNTRAFAHKRFPIGRCAACGSINALEVVDHAALYADYPMHARPGGVAGFGLARIAAARVKRLKRAGVRPPARVLDYGAGAGGFVDALNRAGYRGEGWEPGQGAAPAGPFDAITCQDVIEHVEDPRTLLQEIAVRLAPQGFVFLGAPLADGIELSKASAWVAHLHQPYHRIILSRSALFHLAPSDRFHVKHFDPRFAGEGALFAPEPRFAEIYTALTGGLVETMLTPPPIWRWRWRARLPWPPRQSNFAAVLALK